MRGEDGNPQKLKEEEGEESAREGLRCRHCPIRSEDAFYVANVQIYPPIGAETLSSKHGVIKRLFRW